MKCSATVNILFLYYLFSYQRIFYSNTNLIHSSRKNHPHLSTILFWDALENQLMCGMCSIHANPPENIAQLLMVACLLYVGFVLN